MEGSKFCLFSVALSARFVSSISPRFHFRKHAFCFLPLAAILESPLVYLYMILASVTVF
jgi:long-subunit acyl-CoA synthetase (AMP-forming)